MRSFRLFCGLALLSLLVLPFGCNEKGGGGGAGGKGNTATGNTIPVGTYLSLTGPTATFGQQTLQGEELAVDKINAEGGVNGKKIDLLQENDEGDQQKTATVVNKLITSDKVVAVIGEIQSSLSLAAASICQENHVPMISPSSTNIKVTQKGDYIFRVCFIDPFQGYVVATFAHDKLHAQTAAIMTENGSAYSIDFAKEFKKTFEADGGKIVAEAAYESKDVDYSGALTKIQAANPDIILIPGYYTNAGAICKQARALGIKATILGGDGWDSPELFKTAGDAADGSYFSDHMDIDSTAPVVKEFVDAYHKKFGADQKPGALTALGYDSMMILADAMKRAKVLDGADIRDALAETKDFPGVTGSITINKDRNADKPAVILQVTPNHTFKYVETIAHP